MKKKVNNHSSRFSLYQGAIILLLSLLVLPSHSQAGTDPLQLMLQSESRHRIKVIAEKAQMILQKKSGKKRVFYLDSVLVQDERKGDKSWTRFSAPANIAGTSMLMIENKTGGNDDQWLYLPGFGKTRRIGTAELGDRFVGSDFFYEDMRRVRIKDYGYTLLRSEKMGGKDCWVLEALPKTPKLKKESPYSKRHLWMQKDTQFVVKQRLFDRRQRPLKEMVFKDLVRVKGSAIRANKIVVRDIQRKHQTILLTQKRSADLRISESFFSKHKISKQKSPLK